MKRRSVVVAMVSLVALTFAPGARAEFGIESGSFFAKTHAPVPLKSVVGIVPSSSRVIDTEAILAAPPLTQAGAHPDATTSFAFNRTGVAPDDNARDIVIDLPPGFLGDPEAVSACTRAEFGSETTGSVCPPATQVGVISVHAHGFEGGGFHSVPVYRLTAAFGKPASFGFKLVGKPILLEPRVRSGGDYGLAVVAPNASDFFGLLRSTVTFWGVPGNPIHDPERWNPAAGEFGDWGASVGADPRPFLTNPTWCDSGPVDTALRVRSWQDPGTWLPLDPTDPDYHAASPAPTGCERLRFGGETAPATLTMQPAVRSAATPSGYTAKLTLPYNDNPKGLASPTLRDTEVVLPAGVAVNPASANGLGACTSAQIGFLGSGFPAPAPIRFDEAPHRCPDSSKLGTVEITTPLLDHKLSGAVYLAKQGDNPFGSLLAIYIVVEDAETGIVVKLAGRVATDPATGQVTATFDDNPQLPFTEFELKFFGGAGASLVNPDACGTHTTTTELVPWSAPHTPAVTSTDSFTIASGPNGSACAASDAARPNAPEFEAGTVTPIAGGYSPFVLHLGRADGSQQLRALDVTLPPGLTGRLAGIEYCPEAALAVARSREGRSGQGAAELAAPSCPAASRVGAVDVAAGAGPSPLHVQGTAYLAGPYKGAPVSLAIVTPAVAGPFDLGAVVVRSALHVDPATAQIRAISDPIPDLLEVDGNGFPLNVRSVDLAMDRPRFTLNPTSCAEMGIAGSARSVFGLSAPLFSRFQVGACPALGFKPRLRLRLKGGTRRAKNPKLISVVTYPKGSYANISRASVKLPRAAFLDQSHIGTVCTRVQWAADACPARSVYGRAKAWSPLLDQPLRGKVYLRSSDHKLPDLVADLRGPAHQPIRIELVGRTDSVKGALRNTFDAVPDAPVSRFRLELFGGKRGLVVNSTNLCRGVHRAAIRLDAHNGRSHDTRPAVRTDCGKKRRKARRSSHAGAG